MKRTRLSACVFAVAAWLAACHGTGDVDYAGAVSVSSPELVQLSPGVQVVADADEPLFFADGYYWLYRDDIWLRSREYNGGFARVDFVSVPQEIRVIERPQIYAHYRQNSTRYREAYARDQERWQTHRAPTPMANPPPVTAPEQPHPQQQANPIPPSSLPPAANPEAPMSTPNDMRREPESQRSAPAERPDHEVTPEGLRQKPAPAPSAQTPIEDANPTPKAKVGTDKTGAGPQNTGRHDDRSNSGNPDAPSRIAPVTPSNSPTTPSQSETSAPDKDRHHLEGKMDKDDQATPPTESQNNAPLSPEKDKDERDAKTKNERF